VAAAASAEASKVAAEAAIADIDESVDEATDKANEAAASALAAAQSALEAAQDALAAAESAAEAAASASTIDPDNFATADQGTRADTAFGWGNHALAGYAADNAVVKLTGNQTIAGTKTFSSTIAGSINGSAASVSGTTTAVIQSSALATGTANNTTFLRGDRTWQSVPTPTIATTAEAQAGTNNTNFITPLRMREGFNASGSAPVYACRAWVNLDSTTSTGTIRASGNVSSYVRNGTGDHTINFTTAMPDTNYSFLLSSRKIDGNNNSATVCSPNSGDTKTTTAFQFKTHFVTGGVGLQNQPEINIAIFR
jgi:hypothetical protein